MGTDSTTLLLIHQGGLGDVILSLPAFYALRVYHPLSSWILAGNPQPLSLLENRCYAQRILSTQGREWAALYQQSGPVSSALGDLLASVHHTYLFSSGDSHRLIQGLRRAGIKEVYLLPSFPDEKNRIPLPVRQKAVLTSLGVPWPERENYLFLNPEDLQQARRTLSKAIPSAEDKEIWAFHPGSGSPYKNWPWSRFLETALRLRKTEGLTPLFIIGPVEKESGSVPLRPFQEAGLAIIRTPALPVLAGLLSLCRGYLGNDSGVSHLAAAMGIPTLALFGPTDPLLWGPQGKKVLVLTLDLPCSPCPRENMIACPERKCLEAISVFHVIETLLDLRKKTGREKKDQGK